MCAKYVQMQKEFKDQPRSIMKQQINAKERKAVFVYRVLSFGLFASLGGSELFGVKPEKCSIQVTHYVDLAIAVAIAFLLAFSYF